MLVRLLLAMSLATLLAVLGYGTLLAVAQSRPVAGEPVALEPIPVLPEPTRLPRLGDTVPASMEVPRIELSTAEAPLTIVVQDLPTDLPVGSGVAVFAADTGSRFRWLPLPAARVAGGRAMLTTPAPVQPPLRVTLAPSERAAQAGYWLSATLPGNRGENAEVTLRAGVQRVAVHTSSVPLGHGQALRLRRQGDPGWRPIDASRADFVPDRRGDLEFLLGPGTYELSPWTAGPWQPVTLTIPGPKEVSVVFTRPPAAPGGRP